MTTSLFLPPLLMSRGAEATQLLAAANPVASVGLAPLDGTVVLRQLLALAAAIIMARALGLVFRRLRQPPVIGEIIAGVLLGPSLLGWISPQASAFLFSPEAVAFLNIIATLGIVLYMFLAGLELEPKLLRGQTTATAAIAQFGILVPFVAGLLLAAVLLPGLPSGQATPLYFRFFLGIALAVTGFPVLARILTDRHVHNTTIGSAALSSAALADLASWCLLAVLLALMQARAIGGMAAAAMFAAFGAILIFVLRPLMVRLSVVYGNRGRLTQGVLATIFVCLLFCSLAGQMIGLSAILGAFALGAAMPHGSGMTLELTDRLEDLVLVALLPAFFVLIGLRTDLTQLSAQQWLLCGAVVMVAVAARFGAAAAAARLGGFGWGEASALGALMDARGINELIVLNIGFALGIVPPSLFTMLVLMTLVATGAATPIFDWLIPPGAEIGPRAPAAISPALGPVRRAAIVVAISNPEGAANLLDIALAANRSDDPPPHVVALARRPAEGVRSGLREVEQRVAPQPPALAAALDHVHARGTAVTSQAVWTDDPATDILRAAREAQSEWLLLGAHHAVFGSDLRGGVVRSIADRAETIPVKVAVLTPGPAQKLDRIFTVVDHSPHGRAALELAIRLVKRTRRSLHVILVPRTNVKPDLALLEMVKSIGRTEGLRLHTDVLAERNAAQLIRQAPGPVTIIGTNLLDEFNLPATALIKSGNSMIVVQGAERDQSDYGTQPGRGAFGLKKA
jgi:Kef-type K+ transport system membrane component KefB